MEVADVGRGCDSEMKGEEREWKGDLWIWICLKGGILHMQMEQDAEQIKLVVGRLL